MKNTNSDQRSPFINVTPLIDVLLVLLIIFMVVSPLKSARFKAEIPSPLEHPEEPRNPWDLNLCVVLSADEKLSINQIEAGSVSDMGPLTKIISESIRERIARNSIDPSTGRIAKTVFIKAPRSTTYGTVAKVIDAIKGAGAEPLGLQIDQLD